MHSIFCRYFGNIENTRRPGITYRHSALASKIDRLIFHQFRSKSTIKTSQNYRIKINSCIHRVACGTTAYFYTDSYTTDEALIEASSPVFLCPVPSPLLACVPCSLVPVPPCSTPSAGAMCRSMFPSTCFINSINKVRSLRS